MEGIPLSAFPLRTLCSSIGIHSYQAVVDWEQRHERKRDLGAPESDGHTEPHDKGVVQMDDGFREKKQQVREIPNGHHGAEKASKEPNGLGLTRKVELIEDGAYEDRH